MSTNVQSMGGNTQVHTNAQDVAALVGRLLLAIGYKARWAALALAVFTLAAGILFHNYWAVEAAQKMGQQINFWKNVAMTGGFLMAYAFGPGRYSLDRK